MFRACLQRAVLTASCIRNSSHRAARGYQSREQEEEIRKALDILFTKPGPARRLLTRDISTQPAVIEASSGTVYRKVVAEHEWPSLRNDSDEKSPPAKVPGYQQIPLTPLDTFSPPLTTNGIPTLAHGLERVLDVPGVHTVRSLANPTVFHFDPSVEKVYQPHEIAKQAIPPFTPSSMDKALEKLGSDHNCKFLGSTSSVASAVVQLYCTLTNFKDVDLSSLSDGFSRQPKSFTPTLVKPTTFLLRKRGNMYAMDGDAPQRNPRNTILMELGKTLELQLTLSKDEFAKKALAVNEPPAHPGQEVFRYLRLGDMMFRAQLDAVDPTSGRVFDLKTRATAPIRFDCNNYHLHTGYRLNYVSGTFGSFEKEFYDMMRSAFIKYGVQARIGCMDGMFVAYHNTLQLFGFEYIRLADIDRCVSGSTYFADTAFNINMRLLREILTQITTDFQSDCIRVAFYAHPNIVSPYLYIYAEEVETDAGWPSEVGILRHLDSDGTISVSKESEAQTIRVKKYRLDLQTFVNNGRTRGQLNFGPGDNLQVFSKFEAVNALPSVVLKEYCSIIRAVRKEEEDNSATMTMMAQQSADTMQQTRSTARSTAQL